MLCILRLSLTREWFGFTFLWSPAGRCLCGALPIAGTRPPSLSPNVPLHPHLHHLSSLPHTHTQTQRSWQAGSRCLPAAGRPPAAPRCRAPPAAPRLPGSPALSHRLNGSQNRGCTKALSAGDCHQLQETATRCRGERGRGGISPLVAPCVMNLLQRFTPGCSHKMRKVLPDPNHKAAKLPLAVNL